MLRERKGVGDEHTLFIPIDKQCIQCEVKANHRSSEEAQAYIHARDNLTTNIPWNF